MDLHLTGRRALVTGGTKGIGRAVAHRLAEEGCAVAVLARSPDQVEATAGALHTSTGVATVGVPADTTSDEQVRTAVATATATLGGLEILVNCAATSGAASGVASILDLDASTTLGAFDEKLQGYIRCASAVAPHLRRAGWGRIINVAGLAARTVGSPLTSMRNAAVVSMSAHLAAELGRSGVNVTTVHPSVTETERTADRVRARADAEGAHETEVWARMHDRNLIGRLVTADEVADVIAFLASPRSVAITGDVVVAGGGQAGAIHP